MSTTHEEGRFNLSAWALRHQALVVFLIALATAFGILAYTRLAQSEDPPFTFRVMVIRTFWPGATARQVQEQVTDRIGRKLQETPAIDFVRSYSRPGESLMFFTMKDSAPVKDVPETWYQVRKKVGDIAATLPQGVQGPFFNDEFGDVYTNIYTLEGDGFSPAQLHDYADQLRTVLLRVPGVGKVDYFGDPDQHIYVEIANTQLTRLGISPQQLGQAINAQNSVSPAGTLTTTDDRVFVRPTGQFKDVNALADTLIRINNRSFRLGDIATIKRGYDDPRRHANALRRQGRARHRRDDAAGRRRDPARQGARSADGAVARCAARRLATGRSVEHAARGRAFGRRLSRSRRRSGGDRAGGEPRVARRAHRHGGRDLDSGRARRHRAVHVSVRHRPAQGVARHAGARARAARRRRDHRRRDDVREAGARLEPHARGGLRVHQHRVSDADRHARHRLRLPADRAGQVEHRRIHALDLRSVGDRADRVVARRGGADSAARLSPAARAQTRGARSASARRSRARHLRHAFLPAPARLDRLVHRAALRRAGDHGRAVRAGHGGLHAGAAAVLPEFGPSRVARRRAAARRRVVRSYVARGRSGSKKRWSGRPEIDHTVELRRHRRAALLSAARSAIAAAQFRAVRDHGEVGEGSREARAVARTGICATTSRRSARVCRASRTDRRSAIRCSSA